MSNELSSEARHFMKLTGKGEPDEKGYVFVSKQVVIAFSGVAIPPDLCEFEVLPDGTGRSKLTEAGKIVLAWT